MATVTSQAPSANFVQMTTTVTIPVADAPTTLITMRHVQPVSRVRSQ